jgi:hypothetical protein
MVTQIDSASRARQLTHMNVASDLAEEFCASSASRCFPVRSTTTI